VLIGFAGLCLLTLSQNNISLENFGYSLLIVVATVCYGLNVNLVSHNLQKQSPIHVATVSIAFMTIPAAIVLWLEGFLQLDFNNKIVQSSIWASVILGIAGSSIATALFYVLVKKAGGLFASLVTYGIPFVALLWGFLDGEIITALEIICLLIILVGVYLANRHDKKESRERSLLPETELENK
jgi:drug/metabolite transporter (DMT)-like permease